MGLIFRKFGVFLQKARLDFSISGIEISKSRIEKLNQGFFARKSMKKLQKTAKKLKKTKTFLAKSRLKKVKSLILCFLIKSLYFQNLRSEIFCLKISHAFGVKWW